MVQKQNKMAYTCGDIPCTIIILGPWFFVVIWRYKHTFKNSSFQGNNHIHISLMIYRKIILCSIVEKKEKKTNLNIQQKENG